MDQRSRPAPLTMLCSCCTILQVLPPQAALRVLEERWQGLLRTEIKSAAATTATGASAAQPWRFSYSYWDHTASGGNDPGVIPVGS